MCQQAISLLLSDPLTYMSMLAVLQRGSAVILAADDDGVLIHEQKSKAYMLAASSIERGRELLESIPPCTLLLLHQQSLIPEAQRRFGLNYAHTCVQAVYFSRTVLALDSRLDIHPLDENHFDMVWQHYHDLVDAEYLRRRLREGALSGGFLRGELIGFVGEHEEGSIGLLEVLPEYRRQGFGTVLLSYEVNRFLQQGKLPFSQLVPQNEASLRLHRRLGFCVGDRQVTWLFCADQDDKGVEQR